VLLFLHERPLPEWDGKATADLLGIDGATAEAALAGLQVHGLATRRVQPPRRYRYAPPTAAVRAIVERLAQVCAGRPFAVARYLVARKVHPCSISSALRPLP
jgi:DNA-binding MarR family transcriptional regulator